MALPWLVELLPSFLCVNLRNLGSLLSRSGQILSLQLWNFPAKRILKLSVPSIQLLYFMGFIFVPKKYFHLSSEIPSNLLCVQDVLNILSVGSIIFKYRFLYLLQGLIQNNNHTPKHVRPLLLAKRIRAMLSNEYRWTLASRIISFSKRQ